MNVDPQSAANPYLASQTSMDHDTGQTYEPKVFSLTGRIGRLRYLAYSMAINLVMVIFFAFVLGVIAAVTKSETIATVGTGLLWVVMAVVGVVVSRRRLHDLNLTGWLSILQLVPIVNFFFFLYLLFAPGTRGSTRFGAEPAPNNTLVIVLACIFPFVAIAGILAAVAIPAYQGYTNKARFSEVVLATNAAKIAVEICAQDALGGQSGSVPIRGCGGGSNGVPTDIEQANGMVASIATADDGVITATAINGNGLSGQTYILIPAFLDGKVVWKVDGTCKTSTPSVC